MRIPKVLLAAGAAVAMTAPAHADDAQDRLQQLEDIATQGLIDLADRSNASCADFTGLWEGQCSVAITSGEQSLMTTTDKTLRVSQESCHTVVINDKSFTLDLAKNKTVNSALGFSHINESLYWMDEGGALGYSKRVEGMNYAEDAPYM